MAGALMAPACPMSSLKGKRYSLYYRMGQHYCAGCSKWFDFSDMTVDHRIPKSKGGASALDNLQLMCAPCNHRKGDSVGV